MSNYDSEISFKNRMPEWKTVHEAVEITSRHVKICEGDIYRYALTGKIQLSIYFQSPIAFKKNKVPGWKGEITIN